MSIEVGAGELHGDFPVQPFRAMMGHAAAFTIRAGMPELPEVETIARGVDARVRGDRIAEVWFSRHREPFKTPAAAQARGWRAGAS